jgi:hypothetical protein
VDERRQGDHSCESGQRCGGSESGPVAQMHDLRVRPQLPEQQQRRERQGGQCRERTRAGRRKRKRTARGERGQHGAEALDRYSYRER